MVSEDLPTPYLLDPPKENAVPAIMDQEDKSPSEPIIASDASRVHGSRKRLIWLFGILASLSIIGAFFLGRHRQRSVGQSRSPVDERAPLLVASEKSAVPEKLKSTVDIAEKSDSNRELSSTDQVELEGVDDSSKKEAIHQVTHDDRTLHAYRKRR